MSIGALFVVVKILKRPEWNTVQVILKNHFYIFDLEGCSECTVRKASRRETGIWWPHSYLKQTIQDALYVCMLIWLCRNVDDKERQERKGRKRKRRKSLLNVLGINFAEGNEHIIFVNCEKALVKIIIIKTIFKKPSHRLSYHLILHSDMLSWIWQIRTELQELCVTHILQGSGVSTRLLCGYRLWWKEDGEPQCYEQRNHRHVLIRGIIVKAVLH